MAQEGFLRSKKLSRYSKSAQWRENVTLCWEMIKIDKRRPNSPLMKTPDLFYWQLIPPTYPERIRDVLPFVISAAKNNELWIFLPSIFSGIISIYTRAGVNGPKGCSAERTDISIKDTRHLNARQGICIPRIVKRICSFEILMPPPPPPVREGGAVRDETPGEASQSRRGVLMNFRSLITARLYLSSLSYQ